MCQGLFHLKLGGVGWNCANFRDPPYTKNGIFETPYTTKWHFWDHPYTKNGILCPLYNKMAFSRPHREKNDIFETLYTTNGIFKTIQHIFLRFDPPYTKMVQIYPPPLQIMTKIWPPYMKNGRNLTPIYNKMPKFGKNGQKWPKSDPLYKNDQNLTPYTTKCQNLTILYKNCIFETPYTTQCDFPDTSMQRNGIFETPYTKNGIFETPYKNKSPLPIFKWNSLKLFCKFFLKNNVQYISQWLCLKFILGNSMKSSKVDDLNVCQAVVSSECSISQKSIQAVFSIDFWATLP